MFRPGRGWFSRLQMDRTVGTSELTARYHYGKGSVLSGVRTAAVHNLYVCLPYVWSFLKGHGRNLS